VSLERAFMKRRCILFRNARAKSEIDHLQVVNFNVCAKGLKINWLL